MAILSSPHYASLPLAVTLGSRFARLAFHLEESLAVALAFGSTLRPRPLHPLFHFINCFPLHIPFKARPLHSTICLAIYLQRFHSRQNFQLEPLQQGNVFYQNLPSHPLATPLWWNHCLRFLSRHDLALDI